MLAQLAQIENSNLLLVDEGRYVLDKSNGTLYGWGDIDEEGPNKGMTMRPIATLYQLNKGLVGNQGGKLVNMEYWTEGDNGIRVVHQEGGKKLTMIPPKD